MRNKLMCSLGVLITVVSTASVNAQTTASDPELQLEEIVVTAERRSEDLQKTAVSVTVRSGDDMLDQGRLSVGDYLADVAGVSGIPDVTSLNNPFANVTVRGVISNTPGDGSQIPTTAAYTDGVYEGLGSNYDVAAVQVLRGPQGTLYGRSATGGVIAIQTRNPQLGEFTGNVAYTYGSDQLRNAQAAINVPLGEVFAVRIAGMTNEQDGYLSDLPSTQKAMRIKAMFKPNDELSILVGAAAQNNMRQTGGDAYTMSTYDEPTLTGTAATYTLNKDRARQYWAEVNWDLGPATLTYLPAYRYNDYDPNQSYVGPTGMAVGYNPSVTPTDNYLTHEVRLASNQDSAFKWIVGSFYYKSIWENDAYLRWLASGALAFDNNQRRVRSDYGVFGETTFDLSSTLRLTTGLRYDYNKSIHTEVSTSNLTGGAGPTDPAFGLPENLIAYPLTADEGTRTHRNVTYKLRLEKDLSDVNLVYATLSSGFLPGDVQVGTDAAGNPAARPYDQETLNGLELGSKNRFFDETLQLNAAVYYYDYSGYQVDVQPTPWAPGTAHITETSAARMYGLDLDATYLLTKNDQLSATAGFIDAKFTDRSDEFKTYIAQERITGIVPLSLTAAYEHTFPFANGSAIKARVDGRYNSAYDLLAANPRFEDSANPTKFLVSDQLKYAHLSAQTTANASVNWNSPSNKYVVGGYVRNFTNNVYKTGLDFQYNGVVNGSPSIGRTVGVTLRASF